MQYISLFVLLLSPFVAHGAVLNVPGGYATIKAAVAAAAAGDTIVVAPGTYNESGITINKQNLTVASKFLNTNDSSYINQTVLNGGGSTIFTTTSTSGGGFTLAGFKITKCYKPVVLNDLATIKYNYFYDNDSDTISFESDGYGYAGYNKIELAGDDGIDSDSRRPGASLKIEYNTVINSGDDGIEIRLYDFSGAGMTYELNNNEFIGSGEDGIQLIDYPGNSPRVFRIHHNVLSANAQAGLGTMPNGDTIENLGGASMAERVYLYNNTVVSNKVGITGGENMVALNNIVANNPGGGAKFLDGASIVDYSLFFNNGGANIVGSNTGNANIQNLDPLYDAFSYELKSGSPAIDRGTANYVLNGVQVLAEVATSYRGASPDVGAKESGLAAPAPNRAPSVEAGPGQVSLSSSIQLAGLVQDDGLPSGILSAQWSKVDGPGNVTFSSSGAAQSSALLSLQGIYQLRLTASDGELSASDDMQVRYVSGGSGQSFSISSTAPAIFEAEGASYFYGSAVSIGDAGAFAGRAVQAAFGQGTHAFTEHRINLTVAEAGYFVWVRARSGSALSGSLDVSVKDYAPVRLVVPADSYVWLRLPEAVALSAGNWPLIIKAASEGVAWDQLAISTSSAFVPADPASAPLLPAVMTLRPTADGHVQKDYPARNYGFSSRLETDGSPVAETYLKFDVPQYSGSLMKAKIRLYCTNSSSNGPKILRTSNGWTESGLTYNNRPAPLGGVLEDKGRVSSGVYVEFDVTSVIAGGGTYSFVLQPTSSDGADFYSKEGTYKPELVLEFGP